MTIALSRAPLGVGSGLAGTGTSKKSKGSLGSKAPVEPGLGTGAPPASSSLVQPSPSLSRMKGVENSEVLPLASVVVAVTLGPVTAPGKVQLPAPSAMVDPW